MQLTVKRDQALSGHAFWDNQLYVRHNDRRSPHWRDTATKYAFPSRTITTFQNLWLPAAARSQSNFPRISGKPPLAPSSAWIIPSTSQHRHHSVARIGPFHHIVLYDRLRLCLQTVETVSNNACAKRFDLRSLTLMSQISTIVDHWCHARPVVTAMACRISFERYLSAPFSDWTASAPAINAAICGRGSREWIDTPATQYRSRATSVDVHLDSRPTFFTTSSVPETVHTSASIDSRTRLHPPPESNKTKGFSQPGRVPVDPAESLTWKAQYERYC
jgi:hypothetical protein